MEGSHRPPGRLPRMCAHRRQANRGIREDGLARRQPWGWVSAGQGPHVPAGNIHCVERRHARRHTCMFMVAAGGWSSQRCSRVTVVPTMWERVSITF
eukprot:236963-Chlamydomonas_euryale.AAC.1